MSVQCTQMAFCGHTTYVNSVTASSFISSNSQCSRRPRHLSSATGPATGRIEMSLTNDLLMKTLEVGVATFVGNAVASQQAEKQKDKGGFFNLGRKSDKRAKARSKTVDAEKVNNVVAEVLKLAETLPDVVEKGGPEGKKWVKLAICIAIDLVGSGSLGVPFLGDALDLVTAPITATMLQALFGNTFVTVGGLVEEILPGTDAIPTATLAWLAENYGYLKAPDGQKTKG